MLENKVKKTTVPSCVKLKDKKKKNESLFFNQDSGPKIQLNRLSFAELTY